MRRKPTMAILCASLIAGCTADVSQATSAIVIAPPPPCGDPEPDFLCDERLVVPGGLELPYCFTAPPRRADVSVRRLIVAQHGRGGIARKYLSTMTSIINGLDNQNELDAAEQFVVAPQFLQENDICDHGFMAEDLDGLYTWQGSADWARADDSFAPGVAASESSYRLLELLLDELLPRFPNLEEIVFAGQSAGGQLVQRFAALNQYAFPPSVSVRYVPANAWGYMYVSSYRPLLPAVSGSFSFYNPAWFTEPQWPADPVCNMSGTCGGYDDYSVGLDNRPANHYASTISDQAVIAAQFRARTVTYVVGETDVRHDEQCGTNNCEIQMQGRHRRERAQAFVQHANSPTHDLRVVQDFSHGRGVFEQPCGEAAVFDLPHLCPTPIEDHEGGFSFLGNGRAIAFGDIDADGRDEVAVIDHGASNAHVYVLDDAVAPVPYGVLFGIGGWGIAPYPTDVVMADVDGDDDDEIVVSRGAVGAGVPTVLVYRGDGSFLGAAGDDWAMPYVAGAVTAGDLDGDGDDEIGVTRFAGSGPRAYVYDWSGGALAEVVRRGDGWVGGTRPTDIAFGNADSDRFDDELIAISRSASSGARWVVYDARASYAQLASGGAGWANSTRATSVAFGNVDSDRPDELAVGREASAGPRFLLYDHADEAFASIGQDAWSWASDATVVGLAFGNIENGDDAKATVDELAVAVRGSSGHRVLLFDVAREDDQTAVLEVLRTEGFAWRGPQGNAVAFGDVDGLGGDEIGYTRADTTTGHRWEVMAAP